MPDTVDELIAEINRKHGGGSVMRATDPRLDVPRLPTGITSLDLILGGGIGLGRITEIFGWDGSGKSTICHHIARECQRSGGKVHLVDVEHALDPEYARSIGVDTTQLLISQPDTGEEALDIVEESVRSGVIKLVIVDSVAALVPRAELEGEMGDQHVGIQARLMGRALRKIKGAANDSKCSVVFTNQMRMKIGVMFGNPETTSGGLALRFYASCRLKVSGEKPVTGTSGNRIGKETKVYVVKNKLAPPFRSTTFHILFRVGATKEESLFGVDTTADTIHTAINLGQIKKTGNSYYDGTTGERIAVGAINCIIALRKQPDVVARMRKDILVAGLFSQVTPTAIVPVEEETGQEKTADPEEGFE